MQRGLLAPNKVLKGYDYSQSVGVRGDCFRSGKVHASTAIVRNRAVCLYEASCALTSSLPAAGQDRARRVHSTPPPARMARLVDSHRRSKRCLDRFDLTNKRVKVSRIQACIPVVLSTEFQSSESVFVGGQSAAHGLV